MNKIQKRNIIIAFFMFALMSVMIFQKTNAESSKSDAKSMAWYTANIKMAEAKNKECRADSNNAELQATPDCVNSLQALELRFGVKR